MVLVIYVLSSLPSLHERFMSKYVRININNQTEMESHKEDFAANDDVDASGETSARIVRHFWAVLQTAPELQKALYEVMNPVEQTIQKSHRTKFQKC